MKKALFIVAILTAGFYGSALDTSHTLANSDGFWDTTGYVNASVSVGSGVLADSVDTKMQDIQASLAPEQFIIMPVGFILSFR